MQYRYRIIFWQKVRIFKGQRLGRAFGTAAEFITLNSKYVTELPECASFEQGATFGIPGAYLHADMPKD